MRSTKPHEAGTKCGLQFEMFRVNSWIAVLLTASLHNFKIHPLSDGAVLFIRKHVLDDYLQHVVSRHEIAAEPDAAAANHSFWINHAGEIQRAFFAGVHRLSIPKQPHLRN